MFIQAQLLEARNLPVSMSALPRRGPELARDPLRVRGPLALRSISEGARLRGMALAKRSTDHVFFAIWDRPGANTMQPLQSFWGPGG